MNSIESPDSENPIEQEVLALLKRARKHIHSYRNEEKLNAYSREFEEEFEYSYLANPQHPWNLDPEIDEPYMDLFLTDIRWIEEYEDYHLLRLCKFKELQKKENSDDPEEKDHRRALQHRIMEDFAMFAYIRGIHAYSALRINEQGRMDDKKTKAVVEAALEDANEALERVRHVDKGYAFAFDFEAYKAEIHAKRVRSGEALAKERWKRFAEELAKRDLSIVEYLKQNPNAAKTDLCQFVADALEDWMEESGRLPEGFDEDDKHRTRLESRIRKYVDRNWDRLRAEAESPEPEQ